MLLLEDTLKDGVGEDLLPTQTMLLFVLQTTQYELLRETRDALGEGNLGELLFVDEVEDVPHIPRCASLQQLIVDQAHRPDVTFGSVLSPE